MAGGRRATNKSKPGTRRSQAGSVPGWNEEVEPFREEALFLHAIWVNVGRPNKDDLHILRARLRNPYHYAVRRAEKHSDLTKAKKLFEASLTSEMDLLKEMKAINGKKGSSELPDNVGGADGEEEIVDKFRYVYETLYTSAESNLRMDKIKKKTQFND